AFADWRETDRQFPGTQFPANGRVSALSFGVANRLSGLVFTKGANMRTPGSARALACRFRRPRRNYLCEVRKDGACSKKVRDRRGAIAGTRAACAPRILVFMFLLTFNAAGAATLQEQIDAARPGDTIRVKAGVHAEQIKIDKPITLV